MRLIGIRTVTCSILASALVVPIAAADPDEAAPSRKKQKSYFFVHGGSFDGEQSFTSLGDDSGSVSVALGIGRPFHRGLATEFEVLIFGTSYEESALRARSHDDPFETSFTTLALMTNLKARHAFGRFRPSAGIGLGFGLTELSVVDTSVIFAASTPLEDEFGLVGQLTVGADVRITRRGYLGLEFRNIEVLDDFEWHGERIDPGGTTFLLTYRHQF